MTEVPDATNDEIDAAIRKVGRTEDYDNFGEWRAAVDAEIKRARLETKP